MISQTRTLASHLADLRSGKTPALAVVIEISDVLGPTWGREIATHLDKIERARFESLYFEADRMRYAASHAAFRLVLANFLVVRPPDVRFDYGPTRFERPKLADEPHLELSLAHSGNVVAIAMSRCGHIGIDVEAGKVPSLETIANLVYSPLEQRALGRNAADPQVILNAWTAKEAVLKALGFGLRFPPAEIDLSFDDAFEPQTAHIQSLDKRYKITALNAPEQRVKSGSIAHSPHFVVEITTGHTFSSVLGEW